MNLIAVGTHHKTGTHWMADVFRSFARSASFSFLNLSNKKAEDHRSILEGKMNSYRKGLIVFHNHSIFPDIVYSSGFKGIHLVRDPRDILISAVRYQETTDAKWVKKKRRDLGGRSVQESLRNCASMEDKLLFEMSCVGRGNLDRMSGFKRGEVFKDVKYEYLVSDASLAVTKRIATHFGLSPGNGEKFLNAMTENSLFGGINKKDKPHIKDGGVSQYLNVYTQKCYDLFNQLGFDEYLDALGYSGKGEPAFSIHENSDGKRFFRKRRESGG